MNPAGQILVLTIWARTRSLAGFLGVAMAVGICALECWRFVGSRGRFWLVEIMNLVGKSLAYRGVEMARREKAGCRTVLTGIRGSSSSCKEGNSGEQRAEGFLESGLPESEEFS